MSIRPTVDLAHTHLDNPVVTIAIIVGIALLIWLPAVGFVVKSRSVVAIVATVIFGLLLAAIVAFVSRQVWVAIALDQQGRTTEATIVDRWEQDIDAVHSTDTGAIHYCLAFRFTAIQPDGNRIEVLKGQYETTPARKPLMYNRLQVGDRVRVRYLPDNPKIVRIDLP